MDASRLFKSGHFVDPVTGTNTNTIEGTWTHVKNKALRRGGLWFSDAIAMELTQFAWLRQNILWGRLQRTSGKWGGGGFEISDIPGGGGGWFVKVWTSVNF